MKSVLRSLFYVSLPITALVTFKPVGKVKAQIVEDNTVGTQVNPGGKIRGVESERIDGGTIRGKNLFHSFEKFNVGKDRGAYFSNPQGINNIITRVRGGDPSKILGTLGVIKAGTTDILGNANLFLINPAGIQFGPNARLDVGGSFFASTADSLLFDNGFEFSASNSESPPPLLTINTPMTPIGLRLRNNPGNIDIGNIDNPGDDIGDIDNPVDINTELEVPSGKTLALVGGNVNLNGGQIIAPAGRVEIGGLTSPGRVDIGSDGSLSFPQGIARGDVSFSNQAGVDVVSGGGGSVAINSRNLDMSENSFINVGIGKGLGTADSRAGDITINATDKITIDGINDDTDTTAIRNIVFSGGTGNAGNITINAGSVDVTNGAYFDSATFGKGDAGNVNINAANDVQFSEDSGIYSSVEFGAEGKGGDININAGGSFSLSDSAFLNATISGKGDGGNVEINASSISLANSSDITASTSGEGNAGNINLQTDNGNISLANISGIEASTSGEGNAGNVTLKTHNGNISLTDQSEIFSNVKQRIDSEGNPIVTERRGGNVTLKANGAISLANNSLIQSDIRPGGKGIAGDIKVEGQSLTLTGGSQISSGLFREIDGTGTPGGIGKAGNIDINVKDFVDISGVKSEGTNSSAVFSAAAQGTTATSDQAGGTISVTTKDFRIGDGAVVNASTANSGAGGNIEINAKTFSATGGAQVVTTTSDQGDAGKITLNISDHLTIRGSDPNFEQRKDKVQKTDPGILIPQSAESGIFANTSPNSSGKGGSIFINPRPREVTIKDGGTITTSSKGTDQAGNITLDADNLTLADRGKITAQSSTADGGNIDLNIKDVLLLRRESQISASAAGTKENPGNGGNIKINTGLLVGFPKENSDITADASSGAGGRVDIDAASILGIKPLSSEELKRRDPQSNPRNLSSSDITAISQNDPNLSGQVNVNSPDVELSEGLVELPENITDPEEQLAQNPCKQGVGSEFIQVGRGGLPTNPDQALSSSRVRVGLVNPVYITGNSGKKINSYKSSKSTPKRIVPAKGWIFNEKGEVVLTSYDPNNINAQRVRQASGICSGR